MYFVRYLDTGETFQLPEVIKTDKGAVTYADACRGRCSAEVLAVDGEVPGERLRRVALLRS
jgi:hypothetical protein